MIKQRKANILLKKDITIKRFTSKRKLLSMPILTVHNQINVAKTRKDFQDIIESRLKVAQRANKMLRIVQSPEVNNNCFIKRNQEKRRTKTERSVSLKKERGQEVNRLVESRLFNYEFENTVAKILNQISNQKREDMYSVRKSQMMVMRSTMRQIVRKKKSFCKDEGLNKQPLPQITSFCEAIPSKLNVNKNSLSFKGFAKSQMFRRQRKINQYNNRKKSLRFRSLKSNSLKWNPEELQGWSIKKRSRYEQELEVRALQMQLSNSCS